MPTVDHANTSFSFSFCFRLSCVFISSIFNHLTLTVFTFPNNKLLNWITLLSSYYFASHCNWTIYPIYRVICEGFVIIIAFYYCYFFYNRPWNMHIHLTHGSELRPGGWRGWRGCLRSHAAHSDMWTFVCLKGRVNLEAT